MRANIEEIVEDPKPLAREALAVGGRFIDAGVELASVEASSFIASDFRSQHPGGCAVYESIWRMREPR